MVGIFSINIECISRRRRRRSIIIQYCGRSGAIIDVAVAHISERNAEYFIIFVIPVTIDFNGDGFAGVTSGKSNGSRWQYTANEIIARGLVAAYGPVCCAAARCVTTAVHREGVGGAATVALSLSGIGGSDGEARQVVIVDDCGNYRANCSNRIIARAEKLDLDGFVAFYRCIGSWADIQRGRTVASIECNCAEGEIA